MNAVRRGRAVRRLILLLILSGTAAGIHAAGKLVADFRSRGGERVTVIQEMKEYGLDLIFTKSGADPGGKKETRRVRNAFGVVLDRPSVVFLCWIANGHFFAESYQLLDISTFRRKILKVKPEPTGDDLRCLIEENERYFLIHDDFPERERTYLFDREGKALGTMEGSLKKDIQIEGKTYRFSDGRDFGGFKPE